MCPIWKFSAFVLALVMMPGAFEVTENTAHLVAEGHLAHAAPDGDRHGPVHSEHGCTPTLHVCGCHASLALLEAPSLPVVTLLAADFSRRREVQRQLVGYGSSIDRPPQA